MTVLDAFALIAALTGEPATETVRAEFRQGGVLISSVNMAEVIDRLVRVSQLPEEMVLSRLEWLKSGGLTIAPIDESIGELAGLLRARHYHRTSASISMADCMALALCMRRSGVLATADPALAGIARLENVNILALPNSQGRKPNS
jgi:PIN domain nuclease of toxin-antitoxin system